MLISRLQILIWLGKAARENGLAHWVLKKANDKIMREMGLQVLEPHELAHDVNRSRSGKSAEGLTVDQLDKSTWREFLADRVDEALVDSRSVDFESLRAVAREFGVSIDKKTSAKSEAEGRDPSVTYALVDDNGEVRRFGRSKAACTARKLGADYQWSALHETMNERIMREREIEDVQSYGEDGEQLDAAIAKLRAAEEGGGGVAPGLDYYVDLAERANKEDRGGAGELDARVDLQDFNLGGLADRLVNERRKRDQADAEREQRAAERDRRDRERQARRDVERREHSEAIRFASILDDAADQPEDDDPGFDF